MLLLLELIALHIFNRFWVSEMKKVKKINNKKKSNRTMKQKRLPYVKLKKSNKDNKQRWRKRHDAKKLRRRKIAKSRLKRKREEGRNKRSMSANSRNF